MSRRKRKRSKQKSPAYPHNDGPPAARNLLTSGPSASRTPEPPSDSRVRIAGRGRLFLAVTMTAAVAWWLTLVILASVAANPVTINAEQILRSDYVVKGVVTGDSTTVRIEQVWTINGHRKPLSGSIDVDNLEQTGAREGITFLFPISRDDEGRFRVTETRLPNEMPMIYPAGAPALEQLEAVLEPK